MRAVRLVVTIFFVCKQKARVFWLLTILIYIQSDFQRVPRAIYFAVNLNLPSFARTAERFKSGVPAHKDILCARCV